MRKKITCPNCFNEEKCFEDVQEQDGKKFSSFMCFNCGFTSNSAYKLGFTRTKTGTIRSTQLMNDVVII